MSIAEFQRAFAELIASPERCLDLRDGAAGLADYQLSARERQRLQSMVREEGMSINCSLFRVNRLIPVYSVLPNSCRLLGGRLMAELDAFWAASRHATLQYRWEAWRFGVWLQERIAAGLLPGGPVDDAVRLELAIFDAQAAMEPTGRQRIVRLRYDPDMLLDPTIRPEELASLPMEITVMIDATAKQLAIRRTA